MFFKYKDQSIVLIMIFNLLWTYLTLQCLPGKTSIYCMTVQVATDIQIMHCYIFPLKFFPDNCKDQKGNFRFEKKAYFLYSFEGLCGCCLLFTSSGPLYTSVPFSVPETILVCWDWPIRTPFKRQKERGSEYYIFLDLFFETVSCPIATVSLQTTHPHISSGFRQLLLPLRRQLVATTPPLLALVPELSLIVPLFLVHIFVISPFANKVLP